VTFFELMLGAPISVEKLSAIQGNWCIITAGSLKTLLVFRPPNESVVVDIVGALFGPDKRVRLDQR
jgi:hypothetical protein